MNIIAKQENFKVYRANIEVINQNSKFETNIQNTCTSCIINQYFEDNYSIMPYIMIILLFYILYKNV
jgi:hypothetical protein